MALLKLTQIVAKIPKALETGKRTGIGAGSSLLLMVYPSGNMCWAANVPTGQRNAKGKMKYKPQRIGDFSYDFKTGKATGMSLADARKKALELVGKVRKGGIVLKAGKRPPCITLAEYWPQWVRIKLDQGLDPHGWLKNLKTLFKNHLAPLHGMRLDDLTPSTVLTPVMSQDTSQGNKARALTLLRQMLDMAVNQGIINSHNCHHLNQVVKEPDPIGFKFVTADRLKEVFFEPLSGVPLMYRCYYLMIALTGDRAKEALNLRWSWIDEERQLIRSPAEYVKTRHPHDIPITSQVKALIETMRGFRSSMPAPESDVVFQGRRNHDRPISFSVIRSPVSAHCSGVFDLHGFRKALATWIVGESGIPEAKDAADLALDHQILNQVQKAYNHADYLPVVRKALEVWDNYLETQLPPAYLELIRPHA